MLKTKNFKKKLLNFALVMCMVSSMLGCITSFAESTGETILTATDTVTLSNLNPTVIELENYSDLFTNADYSVTFKDNVSMYSGGRAVHIYKEPWTGYPLCLNIPLKLEKDVYCGFEMAVSGGGGASNTVVNIVDSKGTETLIYNSWVGGETISGDFKKFSTKDISLTAGDYTLRLKIEKKGSTTEVLHTYLDYLKFIPVVAEVKGEGKTTLEFEDYAKYFSVFNAASTSNTTDSSGNAVTNNLSGGAALLFDTTLAEGGTKEVNIPVTFEKAGVYSVDFAGSGENSFSQYTVNLVPQNTSLDTISEVARGWDMNTGVDSTGLTEVNRVSRWYTIRKRTSGILKNITIPEAGKYTMQINFEVRSGMNPVNDPTSSVNGKYGYCDAFDYISFTPLVANFSGTEKTTLEFENYVEYFKVVEAVKTSNTTNENNLSGGAAIKFDSWAPTAVGNKEVNIPVTFAKPGVYSVDFAGSGKYDFSQYTINLVLQDASLETVSDVARGYDVNSAVEGYTDLIEYVNTVDVNYPISKRINGVVRNITIPAAGKYTMQIVITTRPGNEDRNYCGAMDYIAFTPIVNAEVKTADDYLTRIEFSSVCEIPANSTKTLEFTVPKTGVYAVYISNKSGADIFDNGGKVSCTIANENDSQTHTSLNLAKRSYGKIGDGVSYFELTADTTYTLTLAPEATLWTDYIDIVCTEVKLDGKVLIPAYYNTKISQYDDTNSINNQDITSSVRSFLAENYGDYNVIGQPEEGTFNTAREKVYTSALFDKNNYVEFSINIPRTGKYNFDAAIGLYVPADSTAASETLKLSVDGTNVADGAYAPGSSFANSGNIVKFDVVTLTAGTHTVRISRDTSTENSIMYLPFIAVEQVEPEVKLYKGSVADENAINAVESGNLIAVLNTKGLITAEEGDKAIFAIYEGGRLAAIEKAALTNEGAAIEIKNFTADAEKIYTVNMFIWSAKYAPKWDKIVK